MVPAQIFTRGLSHPPFTFSSAAPAAAKSEGGEPGRLIVTADGSHSRLTVMDEEDPPEAKGPRGSPAIANPTVPKVFSRSNHEGTGLTKITQGYFYGCVF